MTDTPQDDALVERVARALLVVEDSWNDHEWEQLPNSTKRLFKRNATAAIAAMPIAALRAENEALAEAGETLRREAFLLLQNSEGCAANHYGNGPELHGMPGWLADGRQRIETAARALLGSKP